MRFDCEDRQQFPENGSRVSNPIVSSSHRKRSCPVEKPKIQFGDYSHRSKYASLQKAVFHSNFDFNAGSDDPLAQKTSEVYIDFDIFQVQSADFVELANQIVESKKLSGEAPHVTIQEDCYRTDIHCIRLAVP